MTKSTKKSVSNDAKGISQDIIKGLNQDLNLGISLGRKGSFIILLDDENKEILRVNGWVAMLHLLFQRYLRE